MSNKPNFDPFAHGHLITERFPASDEHGEADYLYGRGAYEEHVASQTIATLRGTFRHDLRSSQAIDHLKRIREAINELMGAVDGPTQSHQQTQQ
jgi:hypothetical protein